MRDVAERHALNATIQSTKADQPFATPHIKQLVASRDARRVKHAITHTDQLGENLPPNLRIATETTLRKPLCPPIPSHH